MKSRWISVVASGEASIAPDMALVSFAVSASEPDLSTARRDVNGRSSAVLARLRELGIADPDLDAPDISIQPEYDYREGQRLTGYRAIRRMRTRVRDLGRLGDVLDEIVRSGANEVHDARMAASDPSPAESAALRQAVSSARAKAGVLAEAADLTLGGVARIEEISHDGPVPLAQHRALSAMAESADVPTEVAAGELSVGRSIRVWFRVD